MYNIYTQKGQSYDHDFFINSHAVKVRETSPSFAHKFLLAKDKAKTQVCQQCHLSSLKAQDESSERVSSQVNPSR